VLVGRSECVETIKTRTSGQSVEEELLVELDSQFEESMVVPVAPAAEGVEPLHPRGLEPG
jgi:hypothetical protein